MYFGPCRRPPKSGTSSTARQSATGGGEERGARDTPEPVAEGQELQPESLNWIQFN